MNYFLVRNLSRLGAAAELSSAKVELLKEKETRLTRVYDELYKKLKEGYRDNMDGGRIGFSRFAIFKTFFESELTPIDQNLLRFHMMIRTCDAIIEKYVINETAENFVELGPITKNGFRTVGMRDITIDEFFRKNKLNPQYFLGKLRSNRPMLAYYSSELDSYLSEEDELRIWRSEPSRMATNLKHCQSLFGPSIKDQKKAKFVHDRRSKKPR